MVPTEKQGAIAFGRGMQQPTGIIFDIMKYAVHDGPGIRTIVFLKGCPLNCWWCHNPEGQKPGLEVMLWAERCIGCGECLKACRQGAIVEATAADGRDAGKSGEGGASVGSVRAIRYLSEKCTVCGDCVKVCYAGARTTVGRVVTVDQVMQEVRKDRAFYEESGGGVTFSGGEPLCQPEFLGALLRECKREEIHTAIETTGFARLEDLLKVAEDTDLFLYDLKLMDDDEHREYTGVSNRVILDNLKALSKQHPNIVVRIPIIPGVTDTDHNLAAICEFLSVLSSVNEVHLLPYHKAGTGKYPRLGKGYELPDLQPPGEETMKQIAERLGACGKRIKIGG